MAGLGLGATVNSVPATMCLFHVLLPRVVC